MLLLDHIEKNYKVDKSRVYVSGVSMGGFGTWMCLNKSPERFAAAVPICGGARPEWAGRLVNTPIWAFHGDKDSVVTVDNTSKVIEAIKKAGGKNIRFTIYEGAEHDIGTQTYATPMIYDWMFRQSLKNRW
jgi:predicted peptidase